MAKVHVGLLYGGLSSEHDISIKSARNVRAALAPAKYVVTPMFIDPSGRWHIEDDETAVLNGGTAPDGSTRGTRTLCTPAQDGDRFLVRQHDDSLKALHLDVVFPILHGQNGEDGRVQGFLQTLGLPYVGPDVLGSAVCMDKEVTKRLLRDSGLPIVPFHIVRRGEQPTYDDVASDLGATLFVKPANSGSSVGTSKVEQASDFQPALDEAFKFDHKVLIETAISGREIECAVLGNEDPKASVLGEIVSTAQFYTYDAKYLDANASRMEVPADLPEALSDRLRDLAVRACLVLGCEGMSRVDFFVTPDETAYVNEVNTIPGFTERSMYPVMWEHTDLPPERLVDRLIQLALDRHARNAALKTTRS